MPKVGTYCAIPSRAPLLNLFKSTSAAQVSSLKLEGSAVVI